MYTKQPKLTPRLLAAAAPVPAGSTLADIGTDHAYLPIWLVLSGRCPRAVASDIKEGPVRRAAETVARYGLTDRIAVRRGAGLSTLAEGEADCIVIAGMGGLVIADILKQGAAVLRDARQIILQPMTAVPELRAFLCRSGWQIRQERLAREEEKLYHILTVGRAGTPMRYTDFECYMGRQLLEEDVPHRAAYLAQQRRRLQRMLDGLRRANTPAAAEKEARVRAYLTQLSVWERTPPRTPQGRAR